MRILIQFSLILTIIVIALGAYTRLSDAGLGCPDWPGCYGQSIPTSAEHITYDGQLHTVDAKKAWIEMIHRYSAACLGLCILMLLIVTIKQARMPLIKLSAALSFYFFAELVVAARVPMLLLASRSTVACTAAAAPLSAGAKLGSADGALRDDHVEPQCVVGKGSA